MSKYFTHIIFDHESASFGLASSGAANAMVHSLPSLQKGMPFSEIDLRELAAMNSHHDNL